MTPDQARQFMDLLLDGLKQHHQETARELLAPLHDKMGQIARIQQVLARMLQQARRDVNATEAMKVVLQESIRADEYNPEKPMGRAPLEIVARKAYELAQHMERFAAVAELQEEATRRAAAQEVEAQQTAGATPGDLAAELVKGNKDSN